MKWICIFLLVLLSCKNKTDTVKDNPTIAIEGEVKDFNYKEISGVFKGKLNASVLEVKLHKQTYKLHYNKENFSGDFAHINDGSIIQLESNKNIPFSNFRIESKDLIISLDKNLQETDNSYLLEKTNP